MRFVLLLPIALVACGVSDLGPDGSTLPLGTYTITRTFAGNSGATGVYRISILSADNSQVIFNWTAGDVTGTLPVRDTATANGNAYLVTWHASGSPTMTLRFTSASCSGTDINSASVSTAWPSCTIATP